MKTENKNANHYGRKKNRRKNHSSLIFFLLTSKTPPHNYKKQKISKQKKNPVPSQKTKGKNKT